MDNIIKVFMNLFVKDLLESNLKTQHIFLLKKMMMNGFRKSLKLTDAKLILDYQTQVTHLQSETKQNASE